MPIIIMLGKFKLYWLNFHSQNIQIDFVTHGILHFHTSESIAHLRNHMYS